MTQNALHFTPIVIKNLHFHLKEPVVFPYIRQYHSTPSLFNISDNDSFQDNSSQSSHSIQEKPLEPHNSNTSTKTVAQYRNVSF